MGESANDPLARPRDDSVLQEFLGQFGIVRSLNAVAAAFARLPYENLTKIIKKEECGNPARARRCPQEVISDHLALGTGGTCFSLTAALLHLVRSLGYEAEPILADRRYGRNTHCALLIWIRDMPHLLDPGYLIVDPIPLTDSARRLKTGFNDIVVVRAQENDRLELHTVENGLQTCRLTYKVQPVDATEFLKAWDESFGWDMMRYPLLTRSERNRQVYMRGNHLQVRTLVDVERRQISADELIVRIAAEFRIAPSVAARALSILKQRGERIG